MNYSTIFVSFRTDFSSVLYVYCNRCVCTTHAVSEGFQCQRCGKVFAYKYYRDKHLKYTRCVDHGDRKFPCHLCTRYEQVHVVVLHR